MRILLYNSKKDTIIESSVNVVIDELYDNLSMIPTIKQLIAYDKSIAKPEEYLNNLKDFISRLDYKLPLFDYATKNIYLIDYENIYSKITTNNMRFPNSNIIELLKETIIEMQNLQTQSEWIPSYIKKLQKNLNFLSNFNMQILKETFIEVFLNTNPTTREITSCIKPSYLPYQDYQSPYYTKSELISMGLNLNLIPDNNIKPWSYTGKELKDICMKLSNYEINTKTLLYNQLYILYNNAKSYIQFYSLFGSYYFNNYLRKTDSIKDLDLEKHISNILKIIEKSPVLESDYEVYRFIESDDYLNDIKVGSFLNENSFISTTRNPFYANDNVFGFILIKIILKKNIQGIALLIESYSNYPQEQEILLPPSKLKLISIDNNFKYYHWNKLAEKKIVKKYIFEYVEPLSYNIDYYTQKYLISNILIPTIDFYKQEYSGNTIQEKTINFFISLPKYNLRRIFKSKIGDSEYEITAYFLTQNKVYSKFFFLQKEDDQNVRLGDEIYMTIQNKSNGHIELLIEIRNIISVNYYHRYSGLNCSVSDNDLLHWLSGLAKSLNIQTIIIHGNYSSYVNIVEKITQNNLLDEYKTIQHINNPDANILNLYTADINTYCVDLIEYIFDNKKRFANKSYISRKIPLHLIDKLKLLKFKELYKLDTSFNSIYKKLDPDISILDMYKIIHIKYPYLIPKLHNLIILTYPKNIVLPWHFYYVLKPFEYMYENKLISYIPMINSDRIEELIKNLDMEVKFIHDNKFRQILK
jgi:hypothetical protein